MFRAISDSFSNSTGTRDFTVTSFQFGVFTLLTLTFIMFMIYLLMNKFNSADVSLHCVKQCHKPHNNI